MILEAILPPSPDSALDSKSDAVYQCAAQNMTIGETLNTTRQTQQEVEQIICELVVRKIVVVRPPSVKAVSDPGQNDEFEKFYEFVGHADYYEMLGVDQDIPRPELRLRYFELSKRFHPDKVFTSASKAQRDKMSFVFQRLTAAYDVLSNPKRKTEYDASIAEVLELRAIEKKLKAAMERKPSDPAAAPPQTDSKPDAPVSISGALTPDVAVENPNPSDPPAGRISYDKFTPSTPPKESDNARREALKRRRAEQAVADLLRRRSDSPSPPPSQSESVEKLLSDATLAASHGQTADAQTLCKKVLAMAPDCAAAKEILKQTTEQQAKSQAQMHIRRGRYAAREGQIKEAKWHLEQAAAIDKTNVEARHLLAEIMLLHERDFFSALAAMKEVIVLGGQKARYFSTLGDIFLEMKELDRAADAYNKALRMEPENKELKKKLKLCKR